MISTRHRPLMLGAFVLSGIEGLRSRPSRLRLPRPTIQDQQGDTCSEAPRSTLVRKRTTIRFEHVDDVESAAFNQDATRIATGSRDGIVRLWDLADPAAAPLVLESEGRINAVAFRPDGARLAAGGDLPDRRWAGVVRVWDLDDPAAAPVVLDFEGTRVCAVALSPDETTLATAAWHPPPRLWNLADPGADPIALPDRSGFGGWVFSLAFSPDGRTLAMGDAAGAAWLWDLAKPATPVVLEHEAEVFAVAFSPDGTRLATGSWDGTVRIWDLADLSAALAVFKTENRWNTSAAFGPDGATLAAGNADGTVRLWDLACPGISPVVLEHEEYVLSVAFSPDGATLATGGGATARLWDLIYPNAAPSASPGVA